VDLKAASSSRFPSGSVVVRLEIIAPRKGGCCQAWGFTPKVLGLFPARPRTSSPASPTDRASRRERLPDRYHCSAWFRSPRRLPRRACRGHTRFAPARPPTRALSPGMRGVPRFLGSLTASSGKRSWAGRRTGSESTGTSPGTFVGAVSTPVVLPGAADWMRIRATASRS
jgi:hypothetical protein